MSRLETLIRTGQDEALFRINPIRFAAERGLAEIEAINLYLHATLAGLVEMDWLLYCPLCSDVVANFRTLRTVQNHFHCHLCHSDYQATLDDYIAVTFTVAPAVRRIRYHDPDSLPVEDYAFTYKLTSEGLAENGVPMRDLMRSGMRGLSRLRPGDTAEFAFEVEPGTLHGFDMESDASSSKRPATGAPKAVASRSSFVPASAGRAPGASRWGRSPSTSGTKRAAPRSSA